MHSFQPVFHTCHAYRHHWVLQFYTTFGDLDFGWGHKISTKQNSWLRFLAHFSIGQDEIKCGVEAIKVEHPDTILIEI